MVCTRQADIQSQSMHSSNIRLCVAQDQVFGPHTTVSLNERILCWDGETLRLFAHWVIRPPLLQ